MKLLALLAIICSCVLAKEIDPFLTGGTLAVSGEFPSAVLIRAPGTETPLCGGTIIDREHVLTSAQCVFNSLNQLINPFWFTVTAGDLNIVQPTDRRIERKVSRIYAHPNYHPTTRDNDLAVLRLSQPYPEFHNTLESVIRSNRLFHPGAACRLVAWGAATNATNAAIQPDLRVINAAIIETSTCNQADVHANRVLLGIHICAGSFAVTAPASGACLGNIGSGLYCDYQLVGLLSFGTSCGSANHPGVYTDVQLHQDWINSQLVRADHTQPE